jgi:hypothetical protein
VSRCDFKPRLVFTTVFGVKNTPQMHALQLCLVRQYRGKNGAHIFWGLRGGKQISDLLHVNLDVRAPLWTASNTRITFTHISIQVFEKHKREVRLIKRWNGSTVLRLLLSWTWKPAAPQRPQCQPCAEPQPARRCHSSVLESSQNPVDASIRQSDDRMHSTTSQASSQAQRVKIGTKSAECYLQIFRILLVADHRVGLT